MKKPLRWEHSMEGSRKKWDRGSSKGRVAPTGERRCRSAWHSRKTIASTTEAARKMSIRDTETTTRKFWLLFLKVWLCDFRCCVRLPVSFFQNYKYLAKLYLTCQQPFRRIVVVNDSRACIKFPVRSWQTSEECMYQQSGSSHFPSFSHLIGENSWKWWQKLHLMPKN